MFPIFTFNYRKTGLFQKHYTNELSELITFTFLSFVTGIYILSPQLSRKNTEKTAFARQSYNFKCFHRHRLHYLTVEEQYSGLFYPW